MRVKEVSATVEVQSRPDGGIMLPPASFSPEEYQKGSFLWDAIAMFNQGDPVEAGEILEMVIRRKKK